MSSHGSSCGGHAVCVSAGLGRRVGGVIFRLRQAYFYFQGPSRLPRTEHDLIAAAAGRRVSRLPMAAAAARAVLFAAGSGREGGKK